MEVSVPEPALAPEEEAEKLAGWEPEVLLTGG